MRIIKMITFVCILIVFDSVYANDLQINQYINQLLHSVAGLPSSEKIVKLSGDFLGSPYQLEPAGEGGTGYFNQEPLYRLNTFDCETYVNTVLALAMSHNLAEFQKNIRLINYKNGVVSFETRDHFTDADWLDNNMKNGLVQNVSASIAGTEAVNHASAFVDRKEWYQHLLISRIHVAGLSSQEQLSRLNQLHRLSNDVQNTEAHIDYIPIAELLNDDQNFQAFNKPTDHLTHTASNINNFNDYYVDQSVDKSANASLQSNNHYKAHPVDIHAIPSGAVLLLVQPNLDLTKTIGTHINVGHMGFAVWRNGILYFRAASSTHQQVIDIPFLHYITAFSHYDPEGGVSVILLNARNK